MSETPLVVRSISYGGEEHPVTVKRALTVAVSQLPLKDKRAIYKFRLLAGVRWTPTPPKDSGIKLGESAEHGYVKISCEDFPEPAMNLKWVSDRLDDLINEANVRSFSPLISNPGLREACAERERSLQRYPH
jgi:small subunit ribosomal protein S35